MIISFTIKNLRSYKDEAEFSFDAVDSNFNSENVTSIQLEDGEEVRILKSAAVFGEKSEKIGRMKSKQPIEPSK